MEVNMGDVNQILKEQFKDGSKEGSIIRQFELASKSKNKGRIKLNNKEKGVLLESSLRVGQKLLTPTNSLGVASSESAHNPLYDGFKMEPILIGEI